MGSIYKRGNVWYVDVRARGRRIRKRVGRSKKIAELALKDAEIKIARDEFGFAKNDIAIDRFFNLFLEYSAAHNRRTTTERYRVVVDHFQQFLQAQPKLSFLSQVTAEMIDRYKVFRKSSWVNGNGHSVDSDGDVTPNTRKGARAHTINFEIDALRLMFNIAIKWDYLKENPTRGAIKLKVDDAKPPRYLTSDECKRLLKASPTDLYPVYFTLLHTGMRKGEVEYLQWKDVDFNRDRIRIRRKENWIPKSGERDVPMTDGLATLLIKLKKKSGRVNDSDYVFCLIESGHSRNRLRTELIKIAQRAGIDDLTKVHTLRHTFASHLMMSGVDLPTVQKLMGHSDIQTTMIYAHLAPDHLADAVNKLPYN